MDGANGWHQFRYLVLPHLGRAIAVVVMIEMIFLMSVFAEIFTTTAGGPGNESTNLAFLIYKQALMNFDVGVASAGALLAVVLANIAAVFLISWEVALVTYAALGIYFSVQRKKEVDAGRHVSDFERMAGTPQRRASVHDVRTKLDETERRMMAIDHHLNSQKTDELAREIEALREDK